tara:strand:- start:14 stop:220 length:207 start_codon:yes stop_codon:yes gene_type:complete
MRSHADPSYPSKQAQTPASLSHTPAPEHCDAVVWPVLAADGVWNQSLPEGQIISLQSAPVKPLLHMHA